MRKIFTACYATSTLGSFLRSFTFGHIRQLGAVASRFVRNLAAETPLLTHDSSTDGYVFLDVDDTIIEVHGYQKQGSGYGYSGVRGLNALLATVRTEESAPIIIGRRLRRGACGSPRGARRMVSDGLATIKRLRGLEKARVLFRADSAFYGHAPSAPLSKPAPTSP
ncbi:Transposase DDE domain group 1 [Cryobacterium flavum]|uniref:Transposase DDE domain group 1 n=1 Tax=Cryobacterium flavum TaxID=1424659 RepID=A0A5E9G3Y3_9MICO|nr:Transposase DDE domain group 1 [Cryobacterium flavum]